jgi:uncharacterized protein YxjI
MRQYPLELTFKFWSLTPSISILDAQGSFQLYVRQKLFRLREVINVFADERQQQQIYTIRADRIIDFSARYNFSDASGMAIGAVKRRGLRSLWQARYDIFDGDTIVMTIQEENPWVKVCDALFAEIPIVGLFTGYVFNPVYRVARPDGNVVMRLEKIPTFFSRKFLIKQVDRLSAREEEQSLLSLLMLLLLERNRG